MVARDVLRTPQGCPGQAAPTEYPALQSSWYFTRTFGLTTCGDSPSAKNEGHDVDTATDAVDAVHTKTKATTWTHFINFITLLCVLRML